MLQNFTIKLGDFLRRFSFFYALTQSLFFSETNMGVFPNLYCLFFVILWKVPILLSSCSFPSCSRFWRFRQGLCRLSLAGILPAFGLSFVLFPGPNCDKIWSYVCCREVSLNMPVDMKLLIAETFGKLAQRGNIDKITVKALIEECHISRQTLRITPVWSCGALPMSRIPPGKGLTSILRPCSAWPASWTPRAGPAPW